MRLRYETKSKLDEDGRVRVHPMIRKKLGLKAGSPIEFFVTDSGQVGFRAAKSKYVKKRPI